MQKFGSITLCDGTLEWKETFGPGCVFYKWHGMTAWFINERDGKYKVTGMHIPKDLPIFDNFDDAHQYVVDALPEQQTEVLSQLEQQRIERESAERKEKEYKQRLHHLELKDVKADSDIYYTDLPSHRLMTIIKAANAVTLQDVADMTKVTFKKYRNCGTKCCEEIEAMFRIAGIWWTDPASTKSKFAKITDEELIAECKRRGLKVG